MTIQQIANIAAHDLGHEDVHTKAILRVVELYNKGLIPEDEADALVNATYDRGLDMIPLSADFCDEDDDTGYDPYMGCYTGEC
jgi:hypothetical protein